MWAERMVKAVPNLKFIQINTDGITIDIPRDKVPVIKEVCSQLKEETQLEIEDAYYNQMIIRDVSNYIAQYEDDPEHLKLKGCFEIYKELHKDTSMNIVPKALKEYFIHGIPVEETIFNCKDIFDFCLRLKINSVTKATWTSLNETIELSRTTRYYISNHGGGLTVYYNNAKEPTRVNLGFVTTLFNHYEEKENYDINYQFYILECKKIINVIEDKQLSLYDLYDNL